MAALSYMANGAPGDEPPVMEQPKKRGPQPEALTNKAIAKWLAVHPEFVMGRNKRRLATPPGMHAPIMLGLLIDGSADWCGWRSILIGPEHVGKVIAQFVGIEAKRHDGGALSAGQKEFLARLEKDGGLAVVARNADDCEKAIKK